MLYFNTAVLGEQVQAFQASLPVLHSTTKATCCPGETRNYLWRSTFHVQFVFVITNLQLPWKHFSSSEATTWLIAEQHYAGQNIFAFNNNNNLFYWMLYVFITRSPSKKVEINPKGLSQPT